MRSFSISRAISLVIESNFPLSKQNYFPSCFLFISPRRGNNNKKRQYRVTRNKTLSRGTASKNARINFDPPIQPNSQGNVEPTELWNKYPRYLRQDIKSIAWKTHTFACLWPSKNSDVKNKINDKSIYLCVSFYATIYFLRTRTLSWITTRSRTTMQAGSRLRMKELFTRGT